MIHTRDSRAGALLLFALASAIFFSPVLKSGAVLLPTSFLSGFSVFSRDVPNVLSADWHPLQWDALAQYYPWRQFAARHLRRGILPLWNPHQFCGAPFMANHQSAVLYPPNVLFWLTDPARAFGFSAMLHAVLGAFGAFALAKHLKLSDASAFISGIAFMFNGFSIAWLELPTLMNAASWLPLIFLFASKTFSLPSVANGLLFSVCLAMQLLAGHAQVVLLTILALGVFVALEIIRSRFSMAGCMAIASAGLFSVGLAAAQILPTLELSQMGHRTGGPTEEGYAQMIARALKPVYFLMPDSPFPNRDWNPESTGYVGIVILLLALSAFFSRRNWLSAASWFILAITSVLIAVGSPLCRLLYFCIRVVSQMGGFGRAEVILCFVLAILAGFGFEAIRLRITGRPGLEGGMLLLRHPGIEGAIMLLIAAAILTDMFRFCWGLNRVGRREDVYPQTTLLHRLTEENGRVLFLCEKQWPLPRHPSGTLPPNGAMVYGLNDIQGYDSLQTNAYKTLMFKVENGQQPAATTNGNMLLLSEESVSSPLLRMLDLRFVVSFRPLASRSLTFRSRDGAWIYEMNSSRPYLRTWPSVNSFQAVSQIRQGKMLFVPEAYYPGWQAWSEGGNRRNVRLTQIALTAVESETGRFKMIFSPASFTVGAFVSLTSLGIIAAWGTGRLIRNAKRLKLAGG